MAVEARELLNILPHRYPFLLVDRVLEFKKAERLVALKNVTFNEPFFQGHFPGNPVMPGVLIIEALAQAGGLLLMEEFTPEERSNFLMLFGSIEKARFKRPVTPGDALIMEVQLLSFRRGVCKIQGVARVGNEIAAEATIVSVIKEKTKLSI